MIIPEEDRNGGGITAEDWRTALDRVVPAVVVIRTTACRAFDTESAGSGSATGFVVDKRRGIILTNRHVVQPGPVVAEAMFVNREEVPVYPIYRDPVHDFGFFRYDPSAIQFLSYEEIPLAPEAACVGLDIRVVGNDSGEKLSILAGTLARLDRDAPKYGDDGYNDFNTFYLQAASGTKGGSSGSPVIDCRGRAIALNAGGRLLGASAFFLPLQRVVRALKFLQKGRDSSINSWEAVTIPRGTLQVTFLHKGFEETRRLGIRSETEQLVRHASPPEETGMLVVDSVVPDGPAHKHLEAGDVLVRLNGEVTTQFLKMENLLDESINHKVELQIERGGKPMTLDLMVQDLHSITPDHFFEISGAVIHPLSYQQARNFSLRCGLAYVAEQGYMMYRAGLPRHAIIKKFAGQEISKIEDLISAISKLSKGARVPVEYLVHTDPHQTKSVLVTLDRHEWYAPPQIYTRNDSSGLWTIKPALLPESSLLSSPSVNQIGRELASNGFSSHSSEITSKDQAHQHVGQEPVGSLTSMEEFDKGSHSVSGSNGVLSPEGSLLESKEDNLKYTGEEIRGTSPTTNTSVAEHVVEPSLVMLEVHVPWSCMLDGVHITSFWGTGVVIYHSETMGLVAVDRNTVVVSVSDVMLSFAAYPIEIPGEVFFLHPTQNFAIVSYDPSALGAGASLVRAAELLPEPALRRGDSVYLVGLSKSQLITSRKSIITNACAASNVVSAKVPRYRASNMELIELDTDLGTISGVLTDERGRVQALWGSFSTQIKQNYSTHNHEFSGGIPIYTISKILDKILCGDDPPGILINGTQRPAPLVRMLEVELHPTLLSKARSFGLSGAWIQVLMKKDPIRRQVLTVKLCLAGSKAEKLLEQGDMVLAINKKPVTCFRDIEDTCQDLDRHTDGNEKLTLTVFRQGNEIDIDLGTDVRDGKGTTRVVNWCGGLLQDSHPAVRALGFLPEEGHGVYVARLSLGSPAQRYGLGDCKWIIEVNGKPTPDLDAFIAVTKEAEPGEFVRLKTIHLNGKPSVLTLKQDLHYWPTWELKLDPETAMWRRRTIKALYSDEE